MTALAGSGRPRGGPLVMLVLLLAAWIGARAVWWENPFAGIDHVLALPLASARVAPQTGFAFVGVFAAGEQPNSAVLGGGRVALNRSGIIARIDSQLADSPTLVSQASRWQPAVQDGEGGAVTPAADYPTPITAPYLAAPAATRTVGARWSLDTWAFWRQGSDAAPISQGRVPIYGASQAGAVLQYRLAPGARRDPRLYVRVYRALVRRGETELALGASARPLGRVPVRVAGEVRVTDAAFSNEVRPSAYAVTEFALVALPLGTQFEAYGQAGWVGGTAETAFADGQASVTRGVGAVARATDKALRLSIGAAAWGGAQRDAQRIDIGPTIRLDLTVGSVPARLSLDWRERVGGAAAPGSGLAATLSTRF